MFVEIVFRVALKNDKVVVWFEVVLANDAFIIRICLVIVAVLNLQNSGQVLFQSNFFRSFSDTAYLLL